ncbi:MAG: sigma-70 family RNA polymerase sigma factor [Myxococcales bacterium]|nr:sigma-70 family RNA polymerase sigma factor [Myxococcales bacterium]
MPGLLAAVAPAPGTSETAPSLRVIVAPRPLSQHSDAELLAFGREGRREALNELLRRHYRRIVRICERMTHESDHVHDLVQETMLGIVRNIASFRGDASFMTWVFTIARSFAHRQRRRQRAHTRTVAALSRWEENAPREASPESMIARQRLSARFEEALSGLAELDRAVLVARDVEGCTAIEVAEITGLTVSAVKSRLHRARRHIRTTLQAA